ncbi:HAUS augmin-like complex subunit 6 [Betta splendens]|uniref:HAUS augmin-like complex subunit 6 n=1 Tax=Betta splendens TaxID=158456 RepID=A0A6P7PCU6_BETSP|nr:HAUS augmin-like complex subunit 6 [Betta splendens]
MANPALLQKTNGKYLWFCLLGMGFQPEDAARKTNVNVKHINLGPNMFDKPNKDAFYIVTHFLLEKLNPTRLHEAFRGCWPVLNHKADAEFRKLACAWLREIMDETANAAPKVAASIFLSPGGPKFVSLMLNLAKHVMLQEMKTFTTDGSWVPGAAASPASSLDVAVKRLDLVGARFVKAAVAQDRFLHEYQRRAQLLVKSVRDIRAEIANYDELLKRHSSDFVSAGTSLPEKTKLVRSLWSAIDEMLSTTKENQNAVESVLKGDVDQFVLDGTDCGLKIPQRLLQRIEQLPHQLSSGNVYEAGQLNLLSVLELTNLALQLLREERCKVSQVPKRQLSPQHLQEKRQQMARVLPDLHLMRQKISREEMPAIKTAMRELEADWDRKWMDALKDTPLVSFLNEDSVLGFLSPMAPLSFEPAAETTYKSSVFSQYPAKLPDGKPVVNKSQEGGSPSFSKLKSSLPATVERAENSLVTTRPASQANTSLDWLFDTPPSPPRTQPAPPPQASVRKTTPIHSVSVKTKTQILNMECDNLADQFAAAVTTTSPVEGRLKDADLEGLLSTLQGDPFSTRKQLPRTPESLIMDVKSSWRKAIKEDQAEKIRQSLKYDDSITGRLSPLEEPRDLLLSPDPSFQNVPFSDTPVCHKEDLLKSTLSWDNFNSEVPDSSIGTGSSEVYFSLEHETLPELPSCDSLLSSDDDEAEDSKSEVEFVVPSLKTGAKRSPLITPHIGQIDFLDGFSIEDRNKTPECLLSAQSVSGLSKQWPKEPVTPVEALDKVFSLDLDALGTYSPPEKQVYSLPSLITFSPIDDMKH